MINIQGLATEWLTAVADFLPVGWSFGAGMLSTVNPCGFAMLPVYLGLYLGAQQGDFKQNPVLFRVLKAFLVAGVVSLGFVLLFSVIGAALSAGWQSLLGAVPWIGVGIGVALVVLGIWMFAGHSLSAGIFRTLGDKLGDPRNATIGGFFLFGIAYGATSLSCTLPIFLIVVGSASTAGSFLAGLAQFVSYGLGMGLVMLVLTLGIALMKEGLVVGGLRSVMPHLHRVTAVILVLAGIYINYYWLILGGLLTSVFA